MIIIQNQISYNHKLHTTKDRHVGAGDKKKSAVANALNSAVEKGCRRSVGIQIDDVETILDPATVVHYGARIWKYQPS